MKISVVVGVWNRLEAAKRWTKSLSVQSLPVDQYELVVVDYGGTEGLAGWLCDVQGPRVLYIQTRQAKRDVMNVPLALNIGIRRSCGTTVLCTCIDNIYENEFLEKIVKATGPRQLVHAVRLEAAAECGDLDPVADFNHIRTGPGVRGKPSAIGDCQAMQRQEWDYLHGYDEDLDGFAIWDTDLKQRCLVAGLEIVTLDHREAAHIHIAHQQGKWRAYAKKNRQISKARRNIVVRNDEDWGTVIPVAEK